MTLNLISTSQVLGLQVSTSMPSFCSAGDGAQGFMHAKQALYRPAQLQAPYLPNHTLPHLCCSDVSFLSFSGVKVRLLSLFSPVCVLVPQVPVPLPSSAANDFPLETTLVLMGPSWSRALE